MPSSLTITSTDFTSFVTNTVIDPGEVNSNFNLWRGHLLPVDASTSAAVNDTYDVGSATYKFKQGLFSGTVSASEFNGTNAVLSSTLSSSTLVVSNTATASEFKGAFVEESTTSEIFVHTGNGFGSTSTKIRRFTTKLTETGNNITHTTTAAGGDLFTIVKSGRYLVQYNDRATSGNFSMGPGINGSGTTNINSLAVGSARAAITSGSGGLTESISTILDLAANDVISAHTDGFANASTGDECAFRILCVGILK